MSGPVQRRPQQCTRPPDGRGIRLVVRRGRQHPSKPVHPVPFHTAGATAGGVPSHRRHGGHTQVTDQQPVEPPDELVAGHRVSLIVSSEAAPQADERERDAASLEKLFLQPRYAGARQLRVL